MFGFIHLVKFYINYGKEYVRFRSYLKKTFYGKYIYSFFQARLSQANSQNIFEQTKIGVTLTFGHFIPNANAIFFVHANKYPPLQLRESYSLVSFYLVLLLPF